MRKIWKRRNVVYAGLLAAALVLGTVSGRPGMIHGTVKAQETAGENSVTLDGDQQNISYNIYRIADISVGETGESYTLSGDFAGYAVTLDWTDSDNWKDAAQTLASYAVRDKIAAEQSQVTGADGNLNFEGLTDGLYLLLGRDTVQDGYQYRFSPIVIRVPGIGENGTYQIAQTVLPKAERNPVDEKVSVKAVKIWRGDGAAESRPVEVTVQLLSGSTGAVEDEQVLDASNGWTYEWTGLDSGVSWSVVEKTIPTGYSAQVTNEGSTFVVVNTAQPPETEPETETETKPTESETETETKPTESETETETKPTESETESETKPTESETQPETPLTESEIETDETATEPETSVESESETKLIESEIDTDETDIETETEPDKPHTPETPPATPPGNPPRIPQTGLLWWPVPVLVIAGLILVAHGYRNKRHSDGEEK